MERVIGEGGVGVLVPARHVQLEQRVAIKYLLPATLKSPTLVERFLREGRLAASIKSEHVVRIYDVGTVPSGEPYMVMEYLAGSDLRSLVKDGPIPAPDAVDYLLQACEALAEAHMSGIVHRDLKPENFFLAFGPGGTTSVKLLDFGISKMAPTETGSGRPLTTDTDKFGTPSYMSPEQLKAAATVDDRADIWSLGVVLFELLTGKRPFEGDSFPQVCAAIVTEPPRPLRDLLPDAPRALEAVIGRCLEKDPEKRFQDVGEFAQTLALFGMEESGKRGHHIRRVIAGSKVKRPERTSTPRLPPSPDSGPRMETPGGYAKVSRPDLSADVVSGARLARIPLASRVSTPEPSSPAVSPSNASAGTFRVVAGDVAAPPPAPPWKQQSRAPSFVALALTSVLSAAAAVGVMTLREHVVQPRAAAPPPATMQLPPPIAASQPAPVVPAPAPLASIASAAVTAAPVASASAAPLPPRLVAVDPSASAGKAPLPKKPASAQKPFDPTGVVNPFE
jgi:serine/threonine-protein kinase